MEAREEAGLGRDRLSGESEQWLKGRRWRAALAGLVLVAMALGLAVTLGNAGGQAQPEQTAPAASAVPRQAVAQLQPASPTAVAVPPATPNATPQPVATTPTAATEADPVADGLAPAATAPAEVATPTPEPAQPLAATTYTVQEGDTLSDIAERFGVSADAIVWANDGVDSPDFLAVGQQLIVPPVSGILHTVLLGDTLIDIAATYKAALESIIAANALEEPYLISIGQLLVVPGGSPPEPTPAPVLIAAADRPEPPSRGEQTESRPEPAATAAPQPEATVAPQATPPPQATVVPHPQLSAQGAAFIASLLGPAQRSRAETGVPVSVTIAQAILETNWGQSGLARKANNLFGIKGRPLPGPAGVIWMDTWEHVNGRDITVKEPFRAYNTVEESVLDHGRYLRDNERYAAAMRNVGDPRLFVRLIHKAGYATDPAYADKVIRIMDRYNLYVYDQAG